MTIYDWRPFLEQLSRAVLESPYAESYDIPPNVVASGWLGFPGASEEQIAAAEARLKIKLPTTYRDFLKVSNGWRHTGNFIERILPVEEVTWVRDQPEEWRARVIDHWTDAMADIPPTELHPADYSQLFDTLLISGTTDEDEIYLLNPHIVNEEGEWSAWILAHWIPGIEAYASFQALLEYELTSRLDDNRLESHRFTATDTPEIIMSKLPTLIAFLDEKMHFYLGGHPHAQHIAQGLAEVIAQLRALSLSDNLFDKIRSVADEFEEKHRVLNRRVSDELNWRKMLNPRELADALNKVNDMLQPQGSLGKSEGYRQGAANIRWWLNE